MNRFLTPLITALIVFMPSFSVAGYGQSESSGNGSLAVIRGRVVCLDKSGRPADAMFGCDDSTAGYALLDINGKLRAFASANSGAAVFADSRVRQRELQVTAQLNEKNQLEFIRAQSIRDGKLCDIYYFCELCNIRAYAPGLCPCCRNELEFRESPV
jgi:hypothetical protein